MRSAWNSLRKSPSARRRLTLVLATAEEHLVEAHTREAADFLRATEEDLPYERSLEIYYRMIGVPERIREPTAVQALAKLAEQPDTGPPAFDVGAGITGALRRILLRLKGRRADGLRARVDAAARRARENVGRAYLEGASMVVEEFGDTLMPVEAVQLYIEALGIGPGWAERIFHEAVAASGEEERSGPREPDGQAA